MADERAFRHAAFWAAPRAPRYDPRVQTKALIAREIVVAESHARRATTSVAWFTGWLLVTWLGQDLEPPGGWTLITIPIGVLGYAVLTIATLASVWWWAIRVVGTGVLRRVVGTYLAPFWIVAAAGACAGGAVWTIVDDPIHSVWLAVGSAVNVLTAAYAAARFAEIRDLRSSMRQIELAPTEIVMRTWTQEIRARIEAAKSLVVRER